MAVLAPSLLSADFAKLGEDAVKVSEGGAAYLHIDVMDGHFVPNISFGAGVMKSLNRYETAPYDVHLMIENPDKYVGDFVTDKTEYIVVHQETCVHLHRTLQLIKSHGVKAGVAINPATPVSTLQCILADCDLVLVMSVNPGFGGQSFIPAAEGKIRELARIRAEKGYSYAIEVDGGVNLENAGLLKEAGCDILVAGSAVFGAKDAKERVREFNGIIKA